MTTDLAIIEKYGSAEAIRRHMMTPRAALIMAVEMLEHIKSGKTYDAYEYLCRLEAIKATRDKVGNTRHPDYVKGRIRKLSEQLEKLKGQPANQLASKKLALARWQKILGELE